MYYSYYYDIKKTHVVNCGLKMLSATEETNGTINAQFIIYIEEKKDGVVVKREEKTALFNFLGSLRNDDESDYDLDLFREQLSNKKKWIFNVKNNRNAAQNVMLGLITQVAEKNPLGCEIIYEEEGYTSELKAGNIGQLDSQYVEPVVRQTVAAFYFNEGGISEELQVPDTAEYLQGYRLYRMKRFTNVFKEAVDPNTKFVFEANIAPETFDVAVEPTIFDMVLHGIGTFSLNRNSISFMPVGGTASDRMSVTLLTTLTPDQFFNSGLRTASLVKAAADGNGNIKINYANVELNARYNPSNQFTGVTFEGKIRAGSSDRIMSKVDNIIAYYEK